MQGGNLCPSREQGLLPHIQYICVNKKEAESGGTPFSRKQEKVAQGRAAGHLWSLFEMAWPPLLSDRIDFLYLILFLHLLRCRPLRYVHASSTGLSPTSTSPKSAYALGNLCTVAHNPLSVSDTTSLSLSKCTGRTKACFVKALTRTVQICLKKIKKTYFDTYFKKEKGHIESTRVLSHYHFSVLFILKGAGEKKDPRTSNTSASGWWLGPSHLCLLLSVIRRAQITGVSDSTLSTFFFLLLLSPELLALPPTDIEVSINFPSTPEKWREIQLHLWCLHYWKKMPFEKLEISSCICMNYLDNYLFKSPNRINRP